VRNSQAENSSPFPLSTPKEIYAYFQITHTMRNSGQIFRLENLPSWVVGSNDISKNMVIRPFNYAEENSNLRILTVDFGKKSGVGDGPVAL